MAVRASDEDIKYFESLEKEYEPNPKQQDKIIAYIVRGDEGILKRPEAFVTETERANFFKHVKAGHLTQERVSDMLKLIKAPYQENGVGYLFNECCMYPNEQQIRGIIAIATSDSMIRQDVYDPEAFNDRDHIDANSLAYLIKHYPDPAKLETALTPLFEDVQKSNGPKKRLKYEKSLRVLMNIVYGKRLEYWDQVKYLYDEANKPSQRKKPKVTQDDISTENPVPKNPKNENAERKSGVLTSEGNIKKAYKEDDASISDAERRAKNAADLNRLKPIVQMMGSMKKVPLVLEDNARFLLYSIPEYPNITDLEAEKVVAALRAEYLVHNPGAEEKAIAKRLVAATRPRNYANVEDGESPAAAETKNTLHRIVIERYFSKEK